MWESTSRLLARQLVEPGEPLLDARDPHRARLAHGKLDRAVGAPLVVHALDVVEELFLLSPGVVIKPVMEKRRESG